MSVSYEDQQEQALETIAAMRRQEELGYNSSYCGGGGGGVVDYLSTKLPVDAKCRFAMAGWCLGIADFCHYKRETAVIALNCLDRFVSTPSGHDCLMNRDLFQLAAMAALYTSVKIHEQEAMDPKLVSTLSRGVHSPQAVEAMEFKMLNAIQWRVNPPTAMSFVRSMMELLLVPVPDHEQHHLLKSVSDLAEMQIEMIVKEYDFCTFDASSIALACTLNAMEGLGMLQLYAYADFATTMGKILMVDDSLLRDVRIAIYELIHVSDDNDDDETTTTTTTTTTIPRSTKGNGNLTKMVASLSSCHGHVVADATKGNHRDFHSSPRTVAQIG